MKNRDLAEVATHSLKSAWDKETARQTTHKWYGGADTKGHECIQCGLELWDKVNGVTIHALPFGVRVQS